jgi:signal transduction histidine kinase/ligand-binding sensor domain-containing protein/DNA-binding response OmpR family regulator
MRKFTALLILLCFISIFTNAEDRIFKVLNKNDNSPFDGLITSIFRDSYGFLWIGSSGALMRYDGYNFITFTNKKNDSTSLSQSDIEATFQDKQGQLWFCSKFGLNLYNKDNQTFKQIYPYGKNGGIKNRIKGICQLNDSIYFIASYGGGVCRYNSKNGSFQFYIHSCSPTTLPSTIINTVFLDSKKLLWVGSESGGLSLLNYKTGECKNYIPDATNKNTIKDKTVSSIVEDKHGILWVGTWRGGLHSFDPKTETFTFYDNLFPSKTIRTIVKGVDDELWIATFTGIVNFNTSTKTFKLYLHDPFDPLSVNYNVNWSLCYDQEQILWVGSMGRGVSYSLQKNQVFSIPEKWNVKYRETYINAIQKDGSKLWFGTENAGVFIWDMKTGTVSDFALNKALTGQTVSSLKKDSKGNIWIGTNMGLYYINGSSNSSGLTLINETKGFNIYSLIEDGNGGYIAGGWNSGLIHFNLSNSKKQVDIFKSDSKNGLLSNIIWKLFIDKQNRIWVLTSEGVGLWDTIQKKFKLLLSDPNVFAINQDTEKKIWCGSSFGQIFIYDEKRQAFTLYHKFNDDTYHIASIYFTKGILWLTTQNGLIRFDRITKHTRRFTVDDGLPSNFFTWADATLPDGKTIIGTANGPVILNPKNIDKNPFIPNLLITGIEVLGKKKNYPNNTITLKYSENKITINFAALSLSAKGIINYKYRLIGFDNEEIITTDRKAIYTNLHPGNYVFSVSYTTSDNAKPQKPTILNITVLAPWWATWWFRILTFVFLVSVIGIVFYFRLRNIKRKNQQLELIVENRTIELKDANEQLNIKNSTLNQKAKELEILNETKNKLFSIIGHDLKNPMSAIIQLSDLLYDSFDSYNSEKKKNFVMHINSSSRNAYHLLNNLLDWARSQQNFIHINTEPVSISNIIDEVIQLNKDILKSKNIEIKKCINADCNAFADHNMLHTCMRNVVSNAIKYSISNSSIVITVSNSSNSKLKIEIQDSGIGMNKELLENIFSIKKSSHLGTANEKGTGLGLIIVKEFITMMNGSISIDSIENNGSNVQIEIPSTNENVIQKSKLYTKSNSFPELDNELQIKIENIQHLKGKKILIIDDDPHLRLSLQANLEQFASIETLDDATNGIEKILELSPDLIICDVEMPGISGFELCKLVKNNVAISHIPFILLTALDSNTDTIIGLQAGADDYITKPFNRDVLLLKIHYVFKLRTELQNQFKINETVQVKIGSVSSVDERLLEKIITIINERMKDSEFSVEDLSKNIGLSRSHLHRKMISLTNMSTNEFISMIRLKKAAELLKTGKLTISEVAYDTGFNDPRYFSKCFKEFFGKIPSEWK